MPKGRGSYEEKDKTGGSCRLAAGKQVDLRGAGGGPGAADRGAAAGSPGPGGSRPAGGTGGL